MRVKEAAKKKLAKLSLANLQLLQKIVTTMIELKKKKEGKDFYDLRINNKKRKKNHCVVCEKIIVHRLPNAKYCIDCKKRIYG